MPRKNYDPASTPGDPALGDHGCPKCGAAMEPIEMGAKGLAVQQLLLCPSCYLVTWSDQDGLHVRQGVPMGKGVNPSGEPGWLEGEPEEC